MKDIKITKTDALDYLQFKKLLEFENLVHAFTLKSHNVGFRKYDVFNVIKESYEKIENEFKINENEIFQPYQNHTDKIIKYPNEDLLTNSQLNKAVIINNDYAEPATVDNFDGIITNKKDVATLLTFADCMPILLYEPKQQVMANIHSGWKGTVARIGIKAVDMMIKTYNCKAENIICCIAPCIHKDHFIVNDDVRQIYLNEFKDECKIYNIIEDTELTNDKGKQYKIDNILLYKVLLKQIGLLEKNIIDSELCTVCNKELFHSRRAEGNNFNTNATLMMLKND